MKLDKFNLIKEKYGDVASWACWSPQMDDKKKSGIDDLSIFDSSNTHNVIDRLHTEGVLVAYNISRDDIHEPFQNFHSSNPKNTDYKLRYGLIDTNLWGCYMTDILKDFVEVKAEKAAKYFRDNPDQLIPHIKSFKEELNFVCDYKPILFALGEHVYNLLMKNFKNEYQIIKIYHYASAIKLDKFCQQYRDASNKYLSR
jgi:hypothetical protein